MSSLLRLPAQADPRVRALIRCLAFYSHSGRPTRQALTRTFSDHTSLRSYALVFQSRLNPPYAFEDVLGSTQQVMPEI